MTTRKSSTHSAHSAGIDPGKVLSNIETDLAGINKGKTAKQSTIKTLSILTIGASLAVFSVCSTCSVLYAGANTLDQLAVRNAPPQVEMYTGTPIPYLTPLPPLQQQPYSTDSPTPEEIETPNLPPTTTPAPKKESTRTPQSPRQTPTPIPTVEPVQTLTPTPIPTEIPPPTQTPIPSQPPSSTIPLGETYSMGFSQATLYNGSHNSLVQSINQITGMAGKIYLANIYDWNNILEAQYDGEAGTTLYKIDSETTIDNLINESAGYQHETLFAEGTHFRNALSGRGIALNEYAQLIHDSCIESDTIDQITDHITNAGQIYLVHNELGGKPMITLIQMNKSGDEALAIYTLVNLNAYKTLLDAAGVPR